jgi:hypothetical protein
MKDLTRPRETPPRKPYRKGHAPSDIIKDSLPESDRAVHTKLGREAELRVAARLREIYGNRKVIDSGSHASGQKGKPDLLLLTDPPTLVEVKTCQLIHKKRLWGVAKTFIHAWERLTLYARSHLMNRVLVIEYRHKDSSIFVWLPGDKVDNLLVDKLEANPDLGVFHIEFREALERGELLTDRGFKLEPIETSQKKIDGFIEG